MNKSTLLILAAGMSSRYGGLKQIDSVGPHNETILDYSIYDAISAGFNKIVFIIRKSIEDDFKKFIGNKYNEHVEVKYVYQELDKIPDSFILPKDRVKPWGTGHAVLVAHNAINEPFAVINADDFYGAEAYAEMYKFLNSNNYKSDTYAMVAYKLLNTLSDFGVVSRGICDIDNNGNLKKIVETKNIKNIDSNIVYIDENNVQNKLNSNALVSMNFWGFKANFFEYLNNEFNSFLTKNITNNLSEFYIPFVVDNMINNNIVKVKVLNAADKWFGITYKEDKPIVVKNINELIKKGSYPENLWNI